MKAKETPLITALMLTGGHPGRRAWSARALEAFRQQTHPHRELLIVNQSVGKDWAYSVLQPGSTCGLKKGNARIAYTIPGNPPPQLREVFVERGPNMTVGDLRNIGLKEAHGCWILPWDDDDWHHPERMAQMWAHGDGQRAVIINRHVRYDCRRDTAWVYQDPMGCGGIMLYPKSAELHYPSQNQHEDSRLYLDNFADAIHWDNADFPHLYLRFYHGGNLGSVEHIMKQFADPAFDGKWVMARESHWGLTPQAANYLYTILRKHYGVESQAFGELATRMRHK